MKKKSLKSPLLLPKSNGPVLSPGRWYNFPVSFLQKKSSVVGMRVLHVPDEMGDFGVTYRNKGLLLFQRAAELFPTKMPG